MTVSQILALVSGALFVLSLFPATEKYPMTTVAGLLLAIAVFVGFG
jgi:flagellar biosynthesis component FlhA